ncbi:hypothetical protein TBLA_0B07650 [Henningerozyma blattae CBS 6284]|uniref:Dolichyl-phosphate-mannose--protein mannosyltransferase n=1 Tax=Henningerozyma blattae (strain ATCC 34711 / CBS 6284 / DSM 70876 / NBRC 10599 / NRRL Y-10934 / UCD 77-7) TaxID=1071380 RepID=I2GZM9_HENB6|nr:hypothetical protein TBLA_0B07650 [Tetrapisispora blattae CBS 6284]CCH59581.1 hypothetical protein TBLA_0B07650 [Tetrapisispora blattae CBS 6284]
MLVKPLPYTCASTQDTRYKWVKLYLIPTFLTILSVCVRFYRIDKNKTVVWDEAHFGKFGSYYIKHEFYHDVHPPLGKMLIGLSEYLANFDGDFDFESNTDYPKHINFIFMRKFNCLFGAFVIPIMYYTLLELNFNYFITLLVSLMSCLELSFIVLSKFILLDSMLLFFTCTTFYFLARLHNLNVAKRQFTFNWSFTLLCLGISIGCVCSIKWVGLFITVIVGLYTIGDLFLLFYQKSLSWTKYIKHWLIRIIDLIIIPFLIYLFCFKLHFALLYKSGTGDGSTNTLFQINLQNNKIELGPRNIAFGSYVTIRSNGLSPNLLHSHKQTYPVGSFQNQITGYGFADSNNNWIIENTNTNGKGLVRDGMEIFLKHDTTQKYLFSSLEFPSIVSKDSLEVSGATENDDNAVWIVEIMDQLKSANSQYDDSSEPSNVIHPISTFIRFKHKATGCYLTSSGFSYPNWGFKQSEIICKFPFSARDKSAWWNVEEHWNDNLDPCPSDYKPPHSKFWTDFVLINFAMASSNNALVPDEDKFDNLASKPWEWPTLYRGLRMCNWSGVIYRYYLLGSPFNTWLSTISLPIFLLIILKLYCSWQRQSIDLNSTAILQIISMGVLPFLTWLIHYLPFVTMARVTYIHHYLPSLYFAMIVFAFNLQLLFNRINSKFIRFNLMIVLFGGCVYSYYKFNPWAQGMLGGNERYEHMKWINTWDFLL